MERRPFLAALAALACAALAAAAPAAAAATATAELTLDLGQGVKLQLVLIPPGSFTMGDDHDRDAKPAHKVVIAKPFYLGRFEVTQEQWQAAMGADSRSTRKGPQLPVESVHWTECLEFCAKLNAKFPGRSFRLPTEAEWEYACRAGSTTRYSFGDDAGMLSEHAWCAQSGPNPKVTGVADSHPVGAKKPNAWGLYDMHGNVWEWCQTLHTSLAGKEYKYPYVADDGREDTGPASIRKPGGPKNARQIAGARVLRGGSWHHGDKACTSFNRAAADPYSTRYYYGFRVAMAAAD